MVVKKLLILCPTRREYRDLPVIARALNYQLAFDEFGGSYYDDALARNEPPSSSAPDPNITGLIEDLISTYKGQDYSS